MERQQMYKITEEDLQAFLEYLGRKPYIEAAPLIARIASWKKEVPKDKNGKDKPQ